MLELSKEELLSIEGGISDKSLWIGIGLTALNPLVGAGYWVGYYMNS